MREPRLLGSYWTLAVGADPSIPGQRHCPHDFRKRVEAAARAGFTGMGFWHDDLLKLRDTPGFKEMHVILDQNDIHDIEVEWLLDWYYRDERREASDRTRDLLLDAAEVLGAMQIKVSDARNDSVDLPQMTEEFAVLCRQGAECGARVLFEMLPPGISRIPSLDQVIALVRGSGEPNAGIVLDNLHVVRTGTSNEDLLSKLRPGDHLCVEINDGLLAWPQDLRDSIVNKRLMPGDGEFDITGFLDAVNRLGYSGPVGIEVLNEKLRRATLDEAATQAYAKARAAIRRVNWQ